MDIGRAFTFVGEDPKWVSKILIGGLLLLATVVLVFTAVGWLFTLAIVLGYCLQVTRNVLAGQPRPLPEWTNWGGLMTDGFKTLAVQLILFLPVILVSLIFTVPGALLAASDNSGTSGLGGLLTAGGYCLGIPLGLLVALILPIPIARLAATRSIGEALQLGPTFAILRANFVTYLLVFVMYIVTQFIGELGIIACGIGLPFTIFYSYLVNYHLYGQAYLKAQGGQPGLAQPQPYPQSFPY